jgi:hypothetical protein
LPTDLAQRSTSAKVIACREIRYGTSAERETKRLPEKERIVQRGVEDTLQRGRCRDHALKWRSVFAAKLSGRWWWHASDSEVPLAALLARRVPVRPTQAPSRETSASLGRAGFSLIVRERASGSRH